MARDARRHGLPGFAFSAGEKGRQACAELERARLTKCVGNDLNPRCEITARGKLKGQARR